MQVDRYHLTSVGVQPSLLLCLARAGEGVTRYRMLKHSASKFKALGEDLITVKKVIIERRCLREVSSEGVDVIYI